MPNQVTLGAYEYREKDPNLNLIERQSVIMDEIRARRSENSVSPKMTSSRSRSQEENHDLSIAAKKFKRTY